MLQGFSEHIKRDCKFELFSIIEEYMYEFLAVKIVTILELWKVTFD